MRTFHYVVFYNGEECGRGSISLVPGAHRERIAGKVMRTYGPHSKGFTWSITK